MKLKDILLLPLVKTYELEDEPEYFDDLFELCDEFLDYRETPEIGYVMFPVGEQEPEPYDTCEGEPVYMQTVDKVVFLLEEPLVFKVVDDHVIDYGVVKGTSLHVYRQFSN